MGIAEPSDLQRIRQICGICPTIPFYIEPRRRLSSVTSIEGYKVPRGGGPRSAQGARPSREIEGEGARTAALEGSKPPTVPVGEFMMYQREA